MSDQYIDLSHKLEQGVQVYPGDPVFSCRSISIEPYGRNLQIISMGSHTGTHVDAPFHFFDDGKTTDQLPISTFVGPVLRINLTHKAPRSKIRWDDLVSHQHQMEPGVILLLYTGWSDHWCTPAYHDHPYLDRTAAEQIVATGVRVVGIDAFSPDETRADGTVGEGGFGAHEVILGAGGVIAENLTNLRALEGDDDKFIISMIPLSIGNSDGSPVRAFAWKC